VTGRTPRLRGTLDGLPAYRAGQRPAPRTDIVTYKISSNENHYPPLPGVMEAVMRAAGDLNRYPDPFSSRLINALAERFDVPASHVALGTGSVALCGQLIDIAADSGDEVIYAWRSFEAYPIWTQIAGARSVQVPLLPDDRHDLEAMAEAVSDRTRVIFVCSPNNPTGQVVRRAELEVFLDRIPADVLVVLDEAYVEFIDDPDVADGIDIYRERPNVAVLRTFSKAYGLAALRVGFAIAHEPVAEALRKVSLPFGISTIAEEAALASLEREDELLDRVARIVEARSAMVEELRSQGWTVAEQQANFIWLRLGPQSAAFAQACEAEGLSVRPFPDEGVRVTVAEGEANARFLEIARSWAGSKVVSA
jgi:histidinol-phosphate aminotransferase